MARYAAFLRGISPVNATMPALRQAFESAGFTDVKTVLGTGNVLFTARAGSVTSLERKAEAAMVKSIGRSFSTIVRSVDELRELLASDPYRDFSLAPGAKRIVTFLRAPVELKVPLPVELHGAQILSTNGREAFSAYTPTPKGPVFMTLIEKTFGKDVTSRTWETVTKVAR